MDVLGTHTRIGFQLSGGKDSVAALFLLRQDWPRMTVYFCDSGDVLDETQSVLDQIGALVPIVVIRGRTAQVKQAWGLPTDLLPWSSAYAAHHHNTGETPLMQDRVACCSRSIMAPLHDRMVEDGITLIIRGQKECDTHKGALRSGDVVDGIEYLYPIQGWTDEEALAYIKENGIIPQRFYDEPGEHSYDCATCTAWTGTNRGVYLRKHYPLKFQQYRADMQHVISAVLPCLDTLRKEWEACHG